MDGSQLEELDYYKREFNELGATVFRLQEDQARWFREARRSRLAARIIREMYRRSERTSKEEEIASLVVEILVEDMFADRAMVLRRVDGNRFEMLSVAGLTPAERDKDLRIDNPPRGAMTTPNSRLDVHTAALVSVIGAPYLLWSYDADSGLAIGLGNKQLARLQRPFEERDQDIVDTALSVLVDVIRRKDAEKAMIAARREAEQARADLKSFIARFSHELRTPLTAILGYNDLISRKVDGSDLATPVQRYVDRVKEGGNHILAMINDILDASKLDHPEFELEWSDVDLKSLVSGMAASFEPLATAKTIELRQTAIDEDLRVRGDAKRIRQMLINLLGNALKFTQAGGSVTLSLEKRKGFACIAVADTGIGMAMEDVPAALQPFRQIKGNHQSGQVGTGLGLSITKTLADAHGGALTLESSPGQGTTVRIMLPLAGEGPHSLRHIAERNAI